MDTAAESPPESGSPIRTEWVQAIGKMVALLEPLTNDERSLVLRTVSDALGIQLGAPAARPPLRGPTPTPAAPGSERQPVQPGSVQAAIEQCEHLGEFFAMCGSPESGAEKVLVAAAFMQTKAPNDDGGFGTRQLNNALKHLGRAVANATVTLDRLTDRRPQPIIVLKKGSKSAQAHKSYKMTPVGFDEVGRMLAGGGA
jgi:hypothetical protein